MTCDELWQARNQIYADRGYCFKTEHTIAVFGQRCFAPFGVLTDTDKRTIEDIRAVERAQKCKVEG
jgi:YARHG domain